MQFCMVVWECFAFGVCDIDVIACDSVEHFREESDAVGCADDEFDSCVERVMPGDGDFSFCVFLAFDGVAIGAMDGDSRFAAAEADDLVGWKWRAAVPYFYFLIF